MADKPIITALPAIRILGPYRSTMNPTGVPVAAPITSRTSKPPVSMERVQPNSSAMGLKKEAEGLRTEADPHSLAEEAAQNDIPTVKELWFSSSHSARY